jgi:hypothetical protein
VSSGCPPPPASINCTRALTHLLEVGERRVSDQKGIVKDKALRWILLSRRKIRIRHMHVHSKHGGPVA